MTSADDIKDKIKLIAAEKWPNDFQMQLHTINEQLSAYIELQNISTLESNDFIKPILEFSKKEWPDDYEMQLHTFKEQVNAGIEFFNFKTDLIPQDTLEQIKLNAFSEWPDDHTMKLHSINEQIEAYLKIRSL